MKILKNRIIVGLMLSVILAGLAVKTSAQQKPNVFDGGNRWLITAYADCDESHQQWATQGICFLPYKRCASCGIQGFWFSDTFPNWRGGYMQEGDRLLMHGNWAGFGGSDGMVIDLFAGTSPRDEGAGQWIEWLNTGTHGTPDFYVNTRLRRVGSCRIGRDITGLSQQELEKLSNELSRAVKPRLRKDGKPAEYPGDPEQVPLAEDYPKQ